MQSPEEKIHGSKWVTGAAGVTAPGGPLTSTNFTADSQAWKNKPVHSEERSLSAIAVKNLNHGRWLSPALLANGPFNNYVDRILPFFDSFSLRGQFLYPERGKNSHFWTIPPPCVDSFYTLSVYKNSHFWNPSSSCPHIYWMATKYIHHEHSAQPWTILTLDG